MNGLLEDVNECTTKELPPSPRGDSTDCPILSPQVKTFASWSNDLNAKVQNEALPGSGILRVVTEHLAMVVMRS